MIWMYSRIKDTNLTPMRINIPSFNMRRKHVKCVNYGCDYITMARQTTDTVDVLTELGIFMTAFLCDTVLKHPQKKCRKWTWVWGYPVIFPTYKIFSSLTRDFLHVILEYDMNKKLT